MRKATEMRSDGDLQAIQTSVAFQHVADAIEQYRRQFGLAFLALVAFSAVHVGLVVIANLYTLETKVSNGVLTASHSSDGTLAPIATASAKVTYDLSHIMSNLEGEQQKLAISSLEDINFIDENGSYRQYTITGFQLSGYKNSQLKLYTAVGHVLNYVRGRGLSVSAKSESCNCTAPSRAAGVSGRNLLAIDFKHDSKYDVAAEINAATKAQSTAETCAAGVVKDLLAYAQNPKYKVYDSKANTFNWSGKAASAELSEQTLKLATCEFVAGGEAGYAAASKKAQIADLTAQLAELSKGYGTFNDKNNDKVCQETIKHGNQYCTVFTTSPITCTGTGAAKKCTAQSWSMNEFAAVIDSTCMDAWDIKDSEYIQSLSAQASDKPLATYIDGEFNSMVSTVEQLTAIVNEAIKSKTATTVLEALLKAFGVEKLNALIDPSLGSISTKALTKAQATAVNNAADAIEAISNSMRSLISQKTRDCMEHNQKMQKLAMAPLIQGTLDYMQSAKYTTDQSEAKAAALAAKTDYESTQLYKCQQSALLWWKCSNSAKLVTYCTANVAAESGMQACNDFKQQTDRKIDANTADKGFEYVTESWGCKALVTGTSPWSRNGCLNSALWTKYNTEATTNFAQSLKDVTDAALLESAVDLNLAAYFTGAKDMSSFIQTEIKSLVTGSGKWTTSLKAEYLAFKLSNNWDTSKSVDVTKTSTTAPATTGYGCSMDTYAELVTGSTVLSIHAYDACDYGAKANRHPYFTGSYFSKIVGGYDEFTIYLPPKFCTAFMTAVASEPQFILNPNFESTTYTRPNARKLLATMAPVTGDYIIMLHGWGGSSSFLHASSAVMDYAFRGVTTTTGGTGFAACLSADDVASSCSVRAYPGGFFILAPDGGNCPLGNRMWWLNSEFSGFMMDYVVFDLPSYMTLNLGLATRSVGVFGFSMGAYGSLSIVNTYTQNIASIYAANAPMYPNDCFFAYTCHAICMTDMIYCELLFTSFGQVINSYVILWGNSAVVSTGSTDPVGTGVAYHMLKNPTTANSKTMISCHYQTETATHAKGAKKTASVTLGDYVSGTTMTSFISTTACTWQNWVSPAKGESCAPIPGKGTAVKKTKASETSVHVALNGFNSDDGQFTCASKCVPSAIKDLSGVGDVWTYSEKTATSVDCFAFVCSGVTWCVELNESEGSGAYLDPVKSLVASMKFVPFSNVVSDLMVPSAYSKFFNSMPITKFTAENQGVVTSVYSAHATLMYIHCSQNDEMGLYPFHMQYVAMILGALAASTVTMFNTNSEFVADFDDCDMHFFSEHDMKVVISWFSDSLHTFTRDGAATANRGGSVNTAAVFSMATVTALAQSAASSTGSLTGQTPYALCWLKRSGEFNGAGAVVSTPKGVETSKTAANRFLHKQGCSGNMMSTALYAQVQTSITWPDMFTHAAWHGLDAENEQHMDESSSVAVYNAANPTDKVECDYLAVGAGLEQAGVPSLVLAQLIPQSFLASKAASDTSKSLTGANGVAVSLPNKLSLKNAGRGAGKGKGPSRGEVSKAAPDTASAARSGTATASAGCTHILPQK